MTGRRVGMVLQPRDHRFLSIIGRIRLVDCEMSKVILRIPSIRNTNKRLLQLTQAGLLSRFFVGTVGSGRKAIYTLSAKGTALVNAEHRGLKRPSQESLVGDLFVQHQLAVNSIFITLQCQPIPVPGIRLIRWSSFYEPPVKPRKLIPDGYFELEAPSGIRCQFLEVDRGTEALRVWDRKTDEYLQLALSGDFAKVFRQPQFRVLVVTTSERRLQNIRDLVAKRTDKIFWFSTFERIRHTTLWMPVWSRPTGEQDHSLL